MSSYEQRPKRFAGCCLGLLALLWLAGCKGVLQVNIEREQRVPALSLGRVAYISGGDLWVKDLETGRQERLTRDGRNSHPRWSADGRWIAFLKGGQLWVSEAGTGKSHHVGEFPVGEFAWSPAAPQLAYLSPLAGLGVWAADRQTGQILTGADVILPAGRVGWEPGGQWITYDGRHPVEWTVSNLAPDGKAGATAYVVAEPDRISRFESWSPDGRWMTMWLGQALPEAELDGLPLCVVRAGEGMPGCLEDKVLLRAGFAAWSPAGHLAVVLGGGRETWVNKRLALLDPETMAVELVVEAARQAPLHPAWSPDGTRIAYSAGPPTSIEAAYARRNAALAQRRIWIVDVASGQRLQLTRDIRFRDERPLWSADGRHILFARLGAEGASLWLMRADGTDLRRVVDELTPKPDAQGDYGYIDWETWWDWVAPLPGERTR